MKISDLRVCALFTGCVVIVWHAPVVRYSFGKKPDGELRRKSAAAVA